jgi:oxygen-dependent protoporphyrinogen oxidase
MANKITSEYIIIGGGLSGLTLAFYLKNAGKKVIVLESSSRIGGVIRTIRTKGFLMEAGPNTGILSSPEIVELFDDLDGDVSLEKPGNKSKIRWIWKAGRWHPLPAGLIQAVNTPLFSTGDKFRILGEPFRSRGQNEDETVAELVRRRMGKSFLDYAVDPFISGIYAGDPELLVTRHALPKLYRLEQEYGSFIRGAIKKRSEKKEPRLQKASREVFSAKGGLQNLTDALAKRIGSDSIFIDCKDVKVHQSGKGYHAEVEHNQKGKLEIYADSVITTSAAHSLGSMLSFIDQKDIQVIMKLRYAKVVQVGAAYSKWDGIELNAFGGLIPSKEGKEALGILFPSSIFTGRAPEGGALLSVFFGGMKKSRFIEKDDDEIKEIALHEIKETLKSKRQPDVFDIFRYQFAIPQYEKSSEERLKTIEKIENQHPGLILAGNIRDGIGMADRVKQAREIANQLTK